MDRSHPFTLDHNAEPSRYWLGTYRDGYQKYTSGRIRSRAGDNAARLDSHRRSTLDGNSPTTNDGHRRGVTQSTPFSAMTHLQVTAQHELCGQTTDRLVHWSNYEVRKSSPGRHRMTWLTDHGAVVTLNYRESFILLPTTRNKSIGRGREYTLMIMVTEYSRRAVDSLPSNSTIPIIQCCTRDRGVDVYITVVVFGSMQVKPIGSSSL
ncbi:hypothetical protein BJ170DRAFT_725285 [Xylariales sp. AK1849]|nr:hypothetical protein BJ170DRAFT_725285 [Xylariales sp. AK1849]